MYIPAITETGVFTPEPGGIVNTYDDLYNAENAAAIEAGEQPNILQDYANTSSAGTIIAFAKYSDDLKDGDPGLICSFGDGYSVGSVLVEKHG